MLRRKLADFIFLFMRLGVCDQNPGMSQLASNCMPTRNIEYRKFISRALFEILLWKQSIANFLFWFWCCGYDAWGWETRILENYLRVIGTRSPRIFNDIPYDLGTRFAPPLCHLLDGDLAPCKHAEQTK